MGRGDIRRHRDPRTSPLSTPSTTTRTRYATSPAATSKWLRACDAEAVSPACPASPSPIPDGHPQRPNCGGKRLQDCSPMIRAQRGGEEEAQGSDGMLEADHANIFAPLCRRDVPVEEAELASPSSPRPILLAVSGARGPVLIEVPEDVWGRKCRTSARLQALGGLPAAAAREDVWRTWGWSRRRSGRCCCVGAAWPMRAAPNLMRGSRKPAGAGDHHRQWPRHRFRRPPPLPGQGRFERQHRGGYRPAAKPSVWLGRGMHHLWI